MQDMAMIKMFIPEQGSQNMFHKIMVVRPGVKKTVFLLYKRGGGSRPIQKILIRKYSDFL